jgi:hypothetical protein
VVVCIGLFFLVAAAILAAKEKNSIDNRDFKESF